MKKLSRHKAVWCQREWYWPRYAFVPSRQAWDREMIRLNVNAPDSYPASDGCMTELNFKDRLICLVTVNEEQSVSRGRSVVTILAHEAVHVYQKVLEHIGENKPSSEFEAYSIQTILDNLIEAFEATRRPLFLSNTSKLVQKKRAA